MLYKNRVVGFVERSPFVKSSPHVSALCLSPTPPDSEQLRPQLWSHWSQHCLHCVSLSHPPLCFYLPRCLYLRADCNNYFPRVKCTRKNSDFLSKGPWPVHEVEGEVAKIKPRFEKITEDYQIGNLETEGFTLHFFIIYRTFWLIFLTKSKKVRIVFQNTE